SETSEQLWRYDPLSDSWLRMTDIPDAQGATSTGRSGATAFRIGNYMYVGMGGNVYANTVYSDFYRYDPTADNGYGTSSSPYTQLSSIPTGRMTTTSFVIGNTAYCGLGLTANSILNDFWTYNPTTNVWTQINNFGGTARSHPFTQVVNGLPYVGTGSVGNFAQTPAASDVWTWDISPCTTTVNLGRDTTLCTGNIIVLS